MPRKSRPILERIARFIKLRLLHIQDSPQRIATGVAIGFFAAFSPLLGFHILLALVLSFMLRANKLAAVVSVWLNNPITAVPMFYLGYVLGGAITGFFGGSQVEQPQFSQFMAQFKEATDLNVFTSEFWHEILEFCFRVGLELWIGCTILGIVSAICGYFITLRFILWHRKKHPRRRYLDLQ